MTPHDEADLAEAIRSASDPLAIRGGGTRQALGRPVMTGETLDTTRLGAITLYDPGALTLVAGAGTPLHVIEDALAAGGQRLAFEPMDHRTILASDGTPTIGGIVAANISGPRRVQAGACRDSLIGVRFVDGTGQIIKNGGRVMKNVTGYDLVKLLCGSWGTLGVLTEVSLKVLPAPETSASIVLDATSLEDAVTCMAKALGSPCEVSGAAWLPDAEGQTCLRLEGLSSQVDNRIETLKTMFPDRAIRQLGPDETRTLWSDIRDAKTITSGDTDIWRLSVKPGDAPTICARLRAECRARIMLDWGGGLIWAATPRSVDANATAIRAVLAPLGGHATLIRAPEKVRATVPVFQPEPAPIAAVSSRIRDKFDPRRILNPGRMAA